MDRHSSVKNKITKGNLYSIDKIPNSGEEFFINLYKGKSILIEKIISGDKKSPAQDWLCQNKDEWVILLRGKSVIRFENQTINLKEGDYLYIPKKTKHKIDFLSQRPKCIWLAIHIK